MMVMPTCRVRAQETNAKFWAGGPLLASISSPALFADLVTLLHIYYPEDGRDISDTVGIAAFVLVCSGLDRDIGAGSKDHLQHWECCKVVGLGKAGIDGGEGLMCFDGFYQVAAREQSPVKVPKLQRVIALASMHVGPGAWARPVSASEITNGELEHAAWAGVEGQLAGVLRICKGLVDHPDIHTLEIDDAVCIPARA